MVLCRLRRWSAESHRTSNGPRSGLRARLPASRSLLKRAVDVVLALVMIVALLPVLIAVVVLLLFAGDGGWIEKRQRLGRNGRSVTLTRFRELPGGAFGRWLERVGARELPLLFAVLRGKLSFVGPAGAAARDRRRLHRAAAADGAGADRAGAASLPPGRRRPTGSTTPTSRAGRCGTTCGCSPSRPVHHRVSKSSS